MQGRRVNLQEHRQVLCVWLLDGIYTYNPKWDPGLWTYKKWVQSTKVEIRNNLLRVYKQSYSLRQLCGCNSCWCMASWLNILETVPSYQENEGATQSDYSCLHCDPSRVQQDGMRVKPVTSLQNTVSLLWVIPGLSEIVKTSTHFLDTTVTNFLAV